MWFWITILIIAITLVLLVMGLSYFFFNFSLKRAKNDDFAYKLAKMSGYDDNSPKSVADKKELAILKSYPCEDIYINSRDGIKLHAYYFPAENPSGKILLGVHGYKSYARREYAPFMRFYRSLGFDLFLVDDRCHGLSEGKYIGMGNLDRFDCVDWAKYIVSRFGEDVKILVQGVSMGGATVVSASGEPDLPKQVFGIVADCPYTSIWNVCERMLKGNMKALTKPVLTICERICIHRVGYDFKTNTPLDLVKKSHTPTLFVHGENDAMIDYHMSQQLYDACSAEKRLLIVKEAGHGESMFYNPVGYKKAVIDFFNLEVPENITQY